MLLKGKAEITTDLKLFRMLEVVPESEIEKLPSPRVLNTHVPIGWLPKEVKEKTIKTVVLVRNPKDTAVSSYYHTAGAKMFDYDGKFSDYLKVFLKGKGKVSS